jgi:hypothetical protein
MCKGEVIEGIRDIRLGKVPEPLIEAARKVIRARKGNGC